MQLSRIRLPPRVCNGEALIRPRMEDTRFGEPVVNQLVHPSPGEIGLLTASVEYPMPASGDLGPEHCECPSVHGHRVVVEVAADDMPQPPSLFGNWLVAHKDHVTRGLAPPPAPRP